MESTPPDMIGDAELTNGLPILHKDNAPFTRADTSDSTLTSHMKNINVTLTTIKKDVSSCDENERCSNNSHIDNTTNGNSSGCVGTSSNDAALLHMYHEYGMSKGWFVKDDISDVTEEDEQAVDPSAAEGDNRCSSRRCSNGEYPVEDDIYEDDCSDDVPDDDIVDGGSMVPERSLSSNGIAAAAEKELTAAMNDMDLNMESIGSADDDDRLSRGSRFANVEGDQESTVGRASVSPRRQSGDAYATTRTKRKRKLVKRRKRHVAPVDDEHDNDDDDVVVFGEEEADDGVVAVAEEVVTDRRGVRSRDSSSASVDSSFGLFDSECEEGEVEENEMRGMEEEKETEESQGEEVEEEENDDDEDEEEEEDLDAYESSFVVSDDDMSDLDDYSDDDIEGEDSGGGDDDDDDDDGDDGDGDGGGDDADDDNDDGDGGGDDDDRVEEVATKKGHQFIDLVSDDDDDDDDDNDVIECFTPPPVVRRTPVSKKTKKKPTMTMTTTKTTARKTDHISSMIANVSLASSMLRDQVHCVPHQSLHPKRFKRHRNDVCVELFALFNKTIFKDQLPSDMEIRWSKTLNTTAGRTLCSRKGSTYLASIELAIKVVDEFDKLKNTLCHEMIHAAVWIVDHTCKPPHGAAFNEWAARAERVHHELDIRTCHNYQIKYKYNYQCVNSVCGQKIGRHSNSLKLKATLCGHCGSRFRLVPLTNQDGTPRKPRKASPYALFVKEHFARTKARNSGMKHGDIMKELSSMYKEEKERGSPPPSFSL